MRLADSVMVAGFPLTGIASPDLNITIGNVSSLTGPNGDRGLLQITAPVQVGNSGGPIVDESGTVVGGVVSKLDAIKVASATGDVPQNVNFGIALGTVQSFLDSNAVEYEVRAANAKLENSSIAVSLQQATYQVECY